MRPDDAHALTGLALWVIAGSPLLLALQQSGENFRALCERAKLLIGLWLGGGFWLSFGGWLPFLGYLAAIVFLLALGVALNAVHRVTRS
jgi:hypothetical protein